MLEISHFICKQKTVMEVLGGCKMEGSFRWFYKNLQTHKTRLMCGGGFGGGEVCVWKNIEVNQNCFINSKSRKGNGELPVQLRQKTMLGRVNAAVKGNRRQAACSTSHHITRAKHSSHWSVHIKHGGERGTLLLLRLCGFEIKH